MSLRSITTVRRTAALAALLALASASTASATVTRSQITTPADPYFSIANEANSTELRTVSGTTDGTTGDVVDLRCYANGTFWNPDPGQNIAVQSDGSFSGEFDAFDLSDNESGCVLRAIPDGTSPSDTSRFRGPRTLVTYWEPPETTTAYDVNGGGTVRKDHYADVQLLRGSWYSYEINDDALYESAPTDPRTLYNIANWNSYYPIETGGDWESTDQEGDGSALKVDGQNAYVLPTLAMRNYDGAGGSEYPSGVESVQATMTQDRNGDITITERYPVYFCEDNAVFPSTTSSCPSVRSAGVLLERTKRSSDGGATFTMTDRFVSTDGTAHTIDAEYFNASANDYEYAEFQLPGESSWAVRDDHDVFAWTSAPASLLWRDNTGDGSYTGSGAITTMQKPDSTTWDADDEWYTRYKGLDLPAGGASAIEQHFHVAMTSAEVAALAASRRDPAAPPAVAITSPASGTTVGGDSVTVSGTASDNVGVASLRVNGVPTTVNPDGTWAQHVSLQQGANTITATATDGAGNTSSASTTVTYTPGAAAATAKAGRGVAAVKLRTKTARLRGRRLTLSVACAAGEPQNGTLKLRTADRNRKKRRTLETESFQCPGGGRRTVRFLLTTGQVKSLRRKRSQRIWAYVLGRDLSGDAGVWKYGFTLRTR